MLSISHCLIIGNPASMEAVVGMATACSRYVTRADSLREMMRDGMQPDQFARPEILNSPDLILVCQHWPDEFTALEVQQLLARFPLARIVCCYGPWCASDGRTRSIWPAAVRIPIADAPVRLRREIEVINGQRPPLPLTAGLEEVFAFDNS